MFAKPSSQPMLRLDDSSGSKKDLTRIRDNFSAIVLNGNDLWLGGDEGTRIDRMTRDTDGNFGRHSRFDVGKIVNLPVLGSKAPEIDIEGLDFNSGYLWFLGSHSSKRKKPEDDKTQDENRERLATIDRVGNRYTLARVPLNSDQQPAKRCDSLRAARLDGDHKGDLLTRALAADPHLGPFCKIPSKDNGLDLEGLAVRDNRVFVGLRGPVIRSWCVVLELELKESSQGVLRLAKRPLKHFLQLEGLGVRDLAIRGRDLYILAGPSMQLDGPVFVYVWPNALDNAAEAMISRNELRKVLAVPYGIGKEAGRDHAEGIAFLGVEGTAPTVMISYDSPSKARAPEDDQVRVDVFSIGSRDIDS